MPFSSVSQRALHQRARNPPRNRWNLPLALDLGYSEGIAEKPKGCMSGSKSGGTRSQDLETKSAAKKYTPLSNVPEQMDGRRSLICDLGAS